MDTIFQRAFICILRKTNNFESNILREIVAFICTIPVPRYLLPQRQYGKLQNYLIYKIFWENVRICSSSRSWHFQNGKTQEPPKRGVPGLNFKASF